MEIAGLGRCFVTGSAGFIGSHLVERLLEAGNFVTGYDNLSSGKREWLKASIEHPNFRFLEADLVDLNTLERSMSGHDLVIHLGANADIRGGNVDPAIDFQNGIVATHNVLTAMRSSNVRKILFSSSSTVYGETDVQPTSEAVGPLLPITQYGAAKLAAEALISAFCNLYDMQAWMFRFGNVVGARMGRGVLHDFIEKLGRNPRELEILGDGKQEKNYFLVEDCIDGILHAFRHVTDKSCDVFNLGTETNTLVTTIAEIVTGEMGLKNVSFRYTGGDRGWLGDVPRVIYDMGKMRRLGWQAKYSSSEAVRIATRRLLAEQELTRGSPS